MPDQPTTRRGFFGRLVTAGLAAIPFLGGAVVALRSGAARPKLVRPTRVPLCKLSEVPDTGLLERAISYQMRRGPEVETVSEKVFVGREDGAVFAMSSRCTHAGCPVVHAPDDGSEPLKCPCHDAAFDAFGKVLDGPPKRPLDRLELVVPDSDDGLIEVVL